MSRGAPLVRAAGIGKTYRSGRLSASVLDDVSVDLFAGDVTFLVGPSGSGKTTLAMILAGLLRPTTGQVELCGVQIAHEPEARVARIRRAHLGFVFQSFNLFPALSALDNVAEVLAMKGVPLREARQRARGALDQVGLAHRHHHQPGRLSGGERQRVAIARAIADRPSLIVADEPTAALDGATAVSILELLCAHVGPEVGLLLITHDRRLDPFADRQIELADGRICRDERRGEGRA